MSESLFFDPHVRGKVDLRCLHRLVTKPQSDGARVYATVPSKRGDLAIARARLESEQ